MARKKQESKAARIFWRIAISAVGAAMILMAAGSLLLYFFGESASAQVSTTRTGGADDSQSSDRRYTWSVDYTFRDREGETRSGHTTRRGGDTGVKVENTVYYFPAAPFINALESEAEPNLGQPVMTILGVFLLVVMNRKKKKPKTGRKPVEPIDPNDYDDRAEELYQKNDKE